MSNAVKVQDYRGCEITFDPTTDKFGFKIADNVHAYSATFAHDVRQHIDYALARDELPMKCTVVEAGVGVHDVTFTGFDETTGLAKLLDDEGNNVNECQSSVFYVVPKDTPSDVLAAFDEGRERLIGAQQIYSQVSREFEDAKHKARAIALDSWCEPDGDEFDELGIHPTQETMHIRQIVNAIKSCEPKTDG